MGGARGAFCQTCSEGVLTAQPGPYWAAVQFGGPVRKAVHRLKFESRSDLGQALGEELAKVAAKTEWGREGHAIQLVTCVPLSFHRLVERGFNQSGLLARVVARRLGVPFKPEAIRRLRDTEKQSSLGRDERATNVDGAFQALDATIRGKVVLIVDDVVTTGETLRAVSRALMAAGARDVLCVALARAGTSGGNEPPRSDEALSRQQASLRRAQKTSDDYEA